MIINFANNFSELGSQVRILYHVFPSQALIIRRLVEFVIGMLKCLSGFFVGVHSVEQN